MSANNPKRRASNGLALAEENKKPRQDEVSSEEIPQEPAAEICQAGTTGSDAVKYNQIIITGPQKCGRSCLVLSYMEQPFPPQVAKFLSKQYLKLRDGNRPVMIWDLDARNEFAEYRNKSYPEADVALLCFDVRKTTSYSRDRNSFGRGRNGCDLLELLKPWYNELFSYCNENIKVILVGLKKDLKEHPRAKETFFSPAEILMVRNKWKNIEEYKEVSAHTNKDEVKELFEYAISKADEAPKSKSMFANCGFEIC